MENGDTIGIICPGDAMPVEKVSECIRVLNEEWGFKTKVGKTVGNEFHYFQVQIKKGWMIFSKCSMMMK